MTPSFIPTTEFQRVLAADPDPHRRCRQAADLARINTLYMILRAGSGHIGSSLSSVDIVAWLLLEEAEVLHDEPPSAVYFSSKGHDVPALYALLIGLELLDEELLHRFRRIDGLPGHPDVSTPHIAANTGSLGMGVSKAKGMIEAARLGGREQRTFVLTGDGELQEGQIWESLGTAAQRQLHELTVIVDHNKLQSDTWVRDVNDLGDLEARFRSFGWDATSCDGHDLVELGERLDAARAVRDRPTVIIAHTIKGAGVDVFEHTSMAPEERFYRHHSGAPDRSLYEHAINLLTERINGRLADVGQPPLARVSEPAIEPDAIVESNIGAGRNLVEHYSGALVRAGEAYPHVVALDADLMFDTGSAAFAERFPDRFFECGIAEQDMVSQAGAMARAGLIPFVHSFSAFLHARANEQIYNNSSERARVVYVGTLAGLLPAQPGHSHQAVRDVSALAAVPGLVIAAPSTPAQVDHLVHLALTSPGLSLYLRLSSVRCPTDDTLATQPTDSLAVGRGAIVRQGSHVILVAYGPVFVRECLTVANQLADDGVEVAVVDLPWLNRLDADWFVPLVADARLVVSVDDQFVIGGQGSLLASVLAQSDHRCPRLLSLGLTDIPPCGLPGEVLDRVALSAAAIRVAILERLGREPVAAAHHSRTTFNRREGDNLA